MCNSAVERGGAAGNGEQIQESEGGSDQGTNDPDADQPVGPFGEHRGLIGGQRDQVEEEAGHPGADWKGDEHGVHCAP